MKIDNNGHRHGYGDIILLRYHYRDGTPQGVMPMRVVADNGDRLVTWLAAGTEILYWALPDGTDPRNLPIHKRFHAPLTAAPRLWYGNGVLRVIPVDQPYQVVHFWNDHHQFTGWYVNLETPKTRTARALDTIDWHIDLLIDPNRKPSWKDIDEAEAAIQADHLHPDDLAKAWGKGQSIIDTISTWPNPIGDWRNYTPPPSWQALPLPSDWPTW